jgi:hypothetical protein
MRLQVNLTVRGQTHQAGFQGFELHPVQTSQATSPGLVAVMVETPSRGPLELIGDFFEFHVEANLGCTHRLATYTCIFSLQFMDYNIIKTICLTCAIIEKKKKKETV